MMTCSALLSTVLMVAAPPPPGSAPKAPIQVYLLAGQSNMEGKGAANTLDWLGEDPTHGALLDDLKTEDGSWRVRDDVVVEFLDRRGPLTVGFGSPPNAHGPLIGPELGFGMVMGDHHDAPVLLIKTAWGGKDVANDFRSSSAEGGPGPYYTRMVGAVRSAMERLDELVPGADGRGGELAGMVWFQGWNDMVDETKTAAYTENLSRMIRDVRRDLKAPDLPVVIGELGANGEEAGENILRFRAAQRAVAEQPSLQKVVFVPTTPCWDPVAHQLYKDDVWKGEDKERFYRIASDRPYHYLGSGKIYYLMGRAFGEAMIPLVSAPDRSTDR